MRSYSRLVTVVTMAAACTWLTDAASAQQAGRDSASLRPFAAPSFHLSCLSRQDQEVPPTVEEPEPAATIESPWGYRDVSSFFNIREAHSNVERGEWEFEAIFKWSTESGESDEIELAQSLKYGITDAFHIELELEEPRIGEGGDSGAGDLRLTLFYQFLNETDTLPALGAFAQGRFPSGDGSSGVDGTLSAIATKTFGEQFRFHFQGFIQTANGSSGAGGEERRHFQWGLGPGFDYQIDEETLVGLNYLHRVSEEEGQRNQHILELGLVRELASSANWEHGLKLAFDVGLDGSESTPNFGAKLLWDIAWK